MKKWSIFFLLLIMTSVSFAVQTEDCEEATRLAQRAYNLGESPDTFAEQKRLLLRALDLCPQHPEAHNNLGDIFEREQAFEQALKHYRTAVRLKPEFAAAWVGIGDVYYKIGKFMLSLEAYLHACQKDQDARDRIVELLESNRYRVTEAGEILDKESLLLLFDRKRRTRINQMLGECAFRDNSGLRRGSMVPEVIFRNVQFDLGKASLKPESLGQLDQIGEALLELGDVSIIIAGHTDKQLFKGKSPEESFQLNMQLSKDRAATVATYFVDMGVHANYIETYGFGSTQPEVDEDTQEAYAKNRRVTIEVKE